MPEGYTELGRTIKKIDNKTKSIETGKNKSIRAIILKAVGQSYRYMMLLQDPNLGSKEVGPIPLSGTPAQLASLYGEPEKLNRGEGQEVEVIIQYNGSSVNRGVATVVGYKYREKGSRFETSKTANELIAKGTAWAPPGSGML